MKSSRFKDTNGLYISTWILLVLFISHIFLLHGIHNSYILCFGSDGHIGFENPSTSIFCCAGEQLSPEASVPHYSEDACLSMNQCGQCRDIPLLDTCQELKYDQKRKITTQSYLSRIPNHSLSDVAFSPETDFFHYSTAHHVIDSQRKSLQSTVLLI